MDTKRIVSVGIRQTGIEGDKVAKALGAEEATHGPSFLLPPPVNIPIDRNSFIIIGGITYIYNKINLRSLAKQDLDLTRVRLVTTLQDSEDTVDYFTNRDRLEELGIPLDADMLQALMRNQELIPESWKEKKNDKIQYIYFDGAILEYGYFPTRYGIACLSWDNNRWNEGVECLGSRCINTPSAVLEV